jgi:hypothetical protein
MFLPEEKIYWVLDKINALGLEYFNRYYSNYPGTVDINQDPQQQGRLKVSVPIVGNSRANGDKLQQITLGRYAYPSSPFAGPNYGFYFPPEIGDNVWVWFDHGDLTQPHIGGSWWGNPAKGDGSGNTKPATKSELPFEFNSVTNINLGNNNSVVQASSPANSQKLNGVAMPDMTTRGIKSKRGHGLLFEDDEVLDFQLTKHGRETRLELWTGAPDPASAAIETQLPAIKKHRFCMSDALATITIQSYGGHKTEYKDAKNTEVGIFTTTTGLNRLDINDTTKTITVSTAVSSSLTLSDMPPRIEAMTLGTALYQATGLFSILGAANVTITAGGILQIAANGINITSAGTVPCATISGGVVNNTFTGVVTEQYNGGLVQTIAGTQAVTAAQMSLISSVLALGTQAQKYVLLDERFLTVFNAHTHSSPTGPVAQPFTVGPGGGFLTAQVATTDVKAS